MTRATEYWRRLKGSAMGQPTITEDQRELAVILLANALRKDAHLRSRQGAAVPGDAGVGSGATRWRMEASRRYAQGMTDLLAMLFDGGRTVADECLRTAEVMAFGPRLDSARDND
jgi:hypothetical protein